jgi:anti-sigma B factor antagonist
MGKLLLFNLLRSGEGWLDSCFIQFHSFRCLMSSPAQMFVFVSDRLACVKIVGRANFTTSIDFKMLINELDRQGYKCYVLDLSECMLMDSTFLGVMAGMALKFGGGQTCNGREHVIELLNANERNIESLETLGVLHLFKVVKGSDRLPTELTDRGAAPITLHSREEVTQNCLEAHKLLMDICPANISKFKEVTQFLAENLKKLKPEGQEGRG